LARKHDFEALNNATTRIETADGSGTGFFVAPQRLLTCAHVVSSIEIKSAVVVVWKGTRHQGILTRKLPNTNEKTGTFPDIAEIEVSISDHPIVRIVDDYRPQDPVYVYGYSDKNPEGVSVTAGIDGSAHFGKGGDEELFAFKNGQFRPGLSGSPIYNFRTQAVCGMVKRSRNLDTDLGGHGVRAEVIFHHFPALKPLETVVPELEQLTIPQGIKRIVKAMARSQDNVIAELVYVATDLHSTESRHRYSVILEESQRRGFTAVHLSQIPGYQLDPLGKMHSLIEQANLVVFDVSEGSLDVLYQLGYQRGIADDLGPDAVLVISQNEDEPSFSFSPYSIERYKHDQELREFMIERLTLAEASV
jgi:hypothetical protein